MSEMENNQTAVVAEAQEAQPQEAPIDPALLEEMVKAGVLYGRKKSKTHPRMKPFILTTRNGIEIFDLANTLQELEKAQAFLKDTAAKGGLILLVGTTPAAKDLAKALADKFGFPAVTERWLGGTLTNFKTINDRLQYYMKLKADRETGKLEKYTKKERVQFDKEIARLTTLFSGLEKLSRLPDALLVIDAVEHETAVREARRLGIPVVALVNSDTNPETINYPIPSNTRSASGISWILSKLQDSIEIGVREKASLQTTS